MSNLRNVEAKYQDSFNLDAFNRLRTSGTGQRFDTEFIYDKQPDLFSENTVNTATISHNSTSRDVSLDINDVTNGTEAVLASKFHIPYTPGNGQLIEMTGTLNDAGIAGGECVIFHKNGITGVETEYAQADWNISSESDLDFSSSQIFAIDFQSLKVGRLRFFLVRNGTPVGLHEIHNDNIRNDGYWQYPSLPLEYNIYNTATETISEIKYGNGDNAIGYRYKVPVNATTSLRAICCTVKSEAGLDIFNLEGFPRAIDVGTTPITVSTTLIPILSIRPKLLFNSLTNNTLVIPTGYSVQANNPVLFRLFLNPTLTGAAWADVNTIRSAVEYDISATAVSGGVEIDSDYLATGGKNTTSIIKGVLGKSLLSKDVFDNQDILTIAAIRTDTTDSETFAKINWKEIR